MPDIDDPFKPSDSTVIRPRPGAGRRGAARAGRRVASRGVSRGRPSRSRRYRWRASVSASSPLVRAASPLLLLAGQLRGTLSGPDISSLRRHAMDEIRRFEDRARSAGMQNEVVLAARYAICAALDEAVLSTPWGAQSEWTQQSLLVALHREAWGGEKFFDMLDRISGDPKHHIDLMEVQIPLPGAGFRGQVSGRRSRALAAHRYPARPLSEDSRIPRRAAARTLAALEGHRGSAQSVDYGTCRGGWSARPSWPLSSLRLPPTGPGWVGNRAPWPVEIHKIQDSATPVPRSVARDSGITLKERPPTLTMDADGTKSRCWRTFFASGSRPVSAGHEANALLLDVCAAFNQVPRNSISVVGHTDDQPLKGRFINNFDLSRRRAENVAATIKQPA